MIKLQKIDKPNILVENASLWTSEYCDCIKRGEIPSETLKTRYNHRDIKDELIKETSGKCAYCESKILASSPGDVEHIIPKSKCPKLYVEWSNLTLACSRCNREGKKDYYDEQRPLIHPYTDEPEQEFFEIGEFLSGKTPKGQLSITKLKLNRPDLVEARKEKLQLLHTLLSLWANEQDPKRKKLQESILCRECTPEKEYSSTVKAYLLEKGVPVEVDILTHV